MHKTVKRIVKKIKRSYDVKQTVFVGLGQSPAAIIAMLQLQDLNALNLPLSSVTAHPEGKGRMNKPLNKIQLENLFLHLDHFFPNLEQYQGKKIVFVDFMYSGKSISSILAYFPKYIEHRIPNASSSIKVEGFAVVSSMISPYMLINMNKNWFIPKLTKYQLYPGQLNSALRNQELDGFSEYGSFYPFAFSYTSTYPYKLPTPKSNYETLKSLIYKYEHKGQKNISPKMSCALSLL